MSNTNFNIPNHPLLTGLPVDCVAGASDALNNCSALLTMLGDLVGGDQSEEFTTLITSKSRYAMYLQLNAAASIIDLVNEAQFKNKSDDGFREVDLLLSDAKRMALEALAEKAGKTVDDFTAELVLDQLAHRLKAA